MSSVLCVSKPKTVGWQVDGLTARVRENDTGDTGHRAPRWQPGAHRTPPTRPPGIPQGSSHHHACSSPDGRVKRLRPVEAKSGAGPARATARRVLQNSA